MAYLLHTYQIVVEITEEKEIIIIALIIAVVLVVYQFIPVPPKVTTGLAKPIIQDGENITKATEIEESKLMERRIVTVKVPAVDNQGNGVATILKVEAMNGEGKVLTDINQLLFWVDTQYSIQTAKTVAGNLTKADLSKTDLIYTIETEASIIEGPSAGAALALATIAVLENKSLNPNVSITGTINPDGSIGPVGGILAKAKASKDVGINIFLVPKGQGLQTVYKPVRQCEKIGHITYCTIEYERESVDITEQSGVEIREVSNVQEALKYFLT